MRKSARMKGISQIYQQQEKQALEALGRCQTEQQKQLEQLQNLMDYRQEYQQQCQPESQEAVSLSKLLEFRSFIHKLDKAIADQQALIQEKDKELEGCRQNWLKKHQKTESLDKLTDKALIEELKIEQKREQAEQDSRSSRNGRSNGMENA